MTRPGLVLMPLALGCLLCVGSLEEQAASRFGSSACAWHQFATDLNVSSWEFQMRADDTSARALHEWQAIVEKVFKLVQRHFPGFKMSRPSTMVLRESEYAISTADGQPLNPAAKGMAYPWKEIGVLRLRQCLAIEDPPRGHKGPRHLLHPGESDLTLKLKGVDPPTFPPIHKGFPHKVGPGRLTVKQEDDVHCDYNRVSYSATFTRSMGVCPCAITSLRGVRRYFPTLPCLLHLSEDWPLPLVFDHHMSKSYWDVGFGGVPGTVQLYLNYTNQATALAGTEAYMWELSLRVTRKDGDAAGGVQTPVQLIASMCDLLSENGWHAVVQ